MTANLSEMEIKSNVVFLNMKFKELRSKGRDTETIRKSLKRERPEFEEFYPNLFKMACSEDFDAKRFSWMMDMKKKVDSDPDSTKDISIKIGKVLAKDFIYSKLDMTKEPQIDMNET